MMPSLKPGTARASGVAMNLVPTQTPSAPRASDAAAGVERSPSVLDLAAHRDHQYVVLVAEVDDLARHAESGDERRGAALDEQLDVAQQVVGKGRQEVDAEGFGRE